MRLAAGFMLALLALRAYVPAGFMPANGAPFALEVCPDGLVAPLQSHRTALAHGDAHHAGMHHAGMQASETPRSSAPGVPHDGRGTHADNCPFGSAPAAAPAVHFVATGAPAPATFQPLHAFSPAEPGAEPRRAHRARGPPLPA